MGCVWSGGDINFVPTTPDASCTLSWTRLDDDDVLRQPQAQGKGSGSVQWVYVRSPNVHSHGDGDGGANGGKGRTLAVVKHCASHEAYVHACLQTHWRAAAAAHRAVALGVRHVVRTHPHWMYVATTPTTDVVMEPLCGSLRDLHTSLGVAAATRACADAALGLRALHQVCRVIHGDVAPSTIGVCLRHAAARTTHVWATATAVAPTKSDCYGHGDDPPVVHEGVVFGLGTTQPLRGHPHFHGALWCSAIAAHKACAPLAYHRSRTSGIYPSPLDDLESLLFVVAWVWLGGHLPWDNLVDAIPQPLPHSGVGMSEAQQAAHAQACMDAEEHLHRAKGVFIDALRRRDGRGGADDAPYHLTSYQATTLGSLFATLSDACASEDGDVRAVCTTIHDMLHDAAMEFEMAVHHQQTNDAVAGAAVNVDEEK